MFNRQGGQNKIAPLKKNNLHCAQAHLLEKYGKFFVLCKAILSVYLNFTFLYKKCFIHILQ